ncbi:UNVERIFIED_CONTAM: hypothetical protein Slati_1068000 [Sesamum latifolium]|uniref:Uncharacterized protein n=1 Tax=Sesamum latifolium TaxID=2727402 RepID=A0AAW2XT56_9LAMI
MEQLINFIIRPPRAEYDPKEDLLDEEFMLKGKWYHRKDLEVINSRGDVLQCSHYMPIICPEGTKLPCVIYCHGNSGCRTDASEAAVILLPSNITVFTLDFSGSGLSGGEHVTLGWNEVKFAIHYMRRAIQKKAKFDILELNTIKGRWSTVHDEEFADELLDSPLSTSTEDTIKQLRSKRPMSTIVMFTKAVIESLKDLEVRQTCVYKPSSSGDTDLPKPEQALPSEKTDPFPARSDSLKTESVSTSAAVPFHTPLPNPDKVLSESPSKCSPSSGAETQETCSHICSSTCNHSLHNDTMNCSKDSSTVLNNPRSDAAAPCPTQEETSRLTSHKETSSATSRQSSEVDMVDNTTVTVKVEKNTTSNVIDGWLRRWELFFRNR